MTRFAFTILCCLSWICAGGSRWVCGETLSGEDRAFFENKIRPVLIEHCYECHSTESKEIGGNLRLDSREGISRGGQSGPVLVAGKPEQSLIIHALRYHDLEMPPEQPLPPNIVKDFVDWIRRGAADPRVASAEDALAASGESGNWDWDALWSFLPRGDPVPPQVRDAQWPQDPIDQFVLARMEAAGVRPTADAPAETLIRRLHYDLIGLPPTAEQVQAFVEDHRRDGRLATKRLVDSLLESPQFGERWGRHWLDVARFGESNGDDGLGRNATFPHAWRYRDYVVESFNDDVAYDQFLTEQIAGDLLPADNAEQRNRYLVATGFLAIGSKPAKAMNNNFDMDVVDDQINVVSTAVMGLSVACARCHDHKHDPIPTRDYYAMAGIFSSTETLYGLAANEALTAPPTELHQLTSVWNQNGQQTLNPSAPLSFPDDYQTAVDQLGPLEDAKLDIAPQGLSVASVEKFSPDGFAKVKTSTISGRFPDTCESYTVAFWFKNETANKSRPITAYLFSRGKLDDKQLPGDHLGIGGKHEPAKSGKLFVFNGNQSKQSVAGSTVIPSGTWNHVVMMRAGKDVKVFLNGNLEIECQLADTVGDSPEYCLASRSDRFAPLVGNLAGFVLFDRSLSIDETDRLYNASGRPRRPGTIGLAMGVREKKKPADCQIHVGGESGKKGPVVPRGFLSAFNQTPTDADCRLHAADFPIDEKQSGRRQLAAWLTHPDHPQTARVMVNRIWLYLFGQGIVATADDFGVYGARPSDPQLLDHLAERFVREGWSVKRMIRAIVLSRSYQRDSLRESHQDVDDPGIDSRGLVGHNRRRLDAESIRDSILMASGNLDWSPGQGSVIAKNDSLINWPPGEATNLHRDSNHRSLYLCRLRHAPPPELVAFDLPDSTRVVAGRDETTLPSQSLFLLNSRFVVEQSESLAQDVLSQENEKSENRVQMIFRRVLQRDPNESESRRAVEYVDAINDSLSKTVAEFDRRELQAWASLCQALFATSEFRYID